MYHTNRISKYFAWCCNYFPVRDVLIYLVECGLADERWRRAARNTYFAIREFEDAGVTAVGGMVRDRFTIGFELPKVVLKVDATHLFGVEILREGVLLWSQHCSDYRDALLLSEDTALLRNVRHSIL